MNRRHKTARTYSLGPTGNRSRVAPRAKIYTAPSRQNIAPPVAKTLDPGPRPISPQQRAYNALLRGETPEPISQEVPPLSERRVVGRRNVDIRRNGKLPSSRNSPARVQLNRRRSKPRLVWGGGVVVVSLLTGLGFLLFSPKLAVQNLVLSGNRQVPAERLAKEVSRMRGQNIVRLETDRFRQALLKEPTIEAVTLTKVWPNTVRIVVKERQPWAVVMTGDGHCYTIDRKLIPFRQSDKPEKGLPRLMLSGISGENSLSNTSHSRPPQIVGTRLRDGAVQHVPLSPPTNSGYPPARWDRVTPNLPVLGKPMTAPGLAEVSLCLEWAANRADFHLDSVTIDPTGKLCLNRKGGTQVRLGSATHLQKKLNVLELLLKQPEMAKAVYVNLYAYDAPAILPRNAVQTVLQPENKGGSAQPTARNPKTDRL